MNDTKIIAINGYIGIIDFYYGIDDYVILENNKKYKLYFAPKKGHYFKLNNQRYYINDFMRVL